MKDDHGTVMVWYCTILTCSEAQFVTKRILAIKRWYAHG